MKALFFGFVLTMISISASAQNCLGEAQFAAKVASVQKNSDGSCKVYIKDVSHYSEHIFCPLSKAEVLSSGIDISDRVGNKCAYDHEDISGVVVLKADGKIYLD